jgi:2-oxoisovalerate dehydrogenase E1 component
LLPLKKTGKRLFIKKTVCLEYCQRYISDDYGGMLLDILDAPVKEYGEFRYLIPFTKALEDQYLPKGRFEKDLLTFSLLDIDFKNAVH